MPTALVQRIDLDLIEPGFLASVLNMLAAAHARGFDYYATLGFRTFSQQDALYAQGRTSPGPRVTNARGGESAHNFGLAIDFCHDADLKTPGLQVDWRGENYRVLGEEAKRAGLVWGGTWATRPDSPHVQVPGYVSASELHPLCKYMQDHVQPLPDRLRSTWQQLKKV